jgi:hypothetical protein
LEVKYNAAFTSLTTYIKTAKFDLWIGIFPSRGPAIALTTQVLTPAIEKRRMVMSVSEQLRITTAPSPSPGWRITSKPMLRIADTVTELIHPFPSEIQDGKAQVEFDEERDVVQEENKTQQIQLLWGNMHVFKATKFKVVLDFDGKHFECEKPAESDYFRVISIDKDTYYLSAVDPLPK